LQIRRSISINCSFGVRAMAGLSAPTIPAPTALKLIIQSRKVTLKEKQRV